MTRLKVPSNSDAPCRHASTERAGWNSQDEPKSSKQPESISCEGPFHGPFTQVHDKVAVALGLNEAIVVGRLHYLMGAVADKPNHRSEGRVWVYNSYESWRENHFPFFSKRTVERTIRSLEEKGVVKSRIPKTYYRAKWYTIDYDVLSEHIAAAARTGHESGARNDHGSLTGCGSNVASDADNLSAGSVELALPARQDDAIEGAINGGFNT